MKNLLPECTRMPYLVFHSKFLFSFLHFLKIYFIFWLDTLQFSFFFLLFVIINFSLSFPLRDSYAFPMALREDLYDLGVLLTLLLVCASAAVWTAQLIGTDLVISRAVDGASSNNDFISTLQTVMYWCCPGKCLSTEAAQRTMPVEKYALQLLPDMSEVAAVVLVVLYYAAFLFENVAVHFLLTAPVALGMAIEYVSPHAGGPAQEFSRCPLSVVQSAIFFVLVVVIGVRLLASHAARVVKSSSTATQ